MSWITPFDAAALPKQVDDWAKSAFGDSFKFRENQKETVISIITSWQEGVEDEIIEAPTGSGKSIIAMCVAGVLSKYYNKKGYILISDLSLLKQYENDIEIHLPHWGCMRGQKTYRCIKNGFNFATGACKLAGCRSYFEIKSKYSDCAPYCEYLMQREKAANAPVVVCTYIWWLLQRNMFINREGEEEAMFPRRDFVICDEAHKLVDIIQSNFSPKVSVNDIARLDEINTLQRLHLESLKDKMNQLREYMVSSPPNGEMLKAIRDYASCLAVFSKASADAMLDVRPSDTGKNDHKVQGRIASLYHWITDYLMRIDTYCDIIEKIGLDTMVASIDAINGSVALRCLNDNYLMSSKFHSKCGKKLYMSATIGDPATYANNINVSSWRNIQLPCVFKYDNSPIYYVDEYKLSYTEKDRSFPYIAKMIEGIMNMYAGMRGIIQTGNYSFAIKLLDYLSPLNRNRVLVYKDTGEKKEMIETFRYSNDKVLVGPSLIEGLSLDDDLCRFQIMMKVPYPSINDNYVKAKMTASQAWYDSATCVSVLQGVGRGVRNENDWCATFILDACFGILYGKASYMFPQEFHKRLLKIPGSSLLQYANTYPQQYPQ